MSTTTALRDEAVSPQRPKHAGLRTRAAACVALLMHMPAEGTAQSEQGIDQFDPEPMLGPRWVQLLDLGDEARSGRWLIAEAVVPVSVLALPAVGDESEEPPPQACELRVGAFVHQYNAADMHGGGGTCTVAARVTRNSTLVVRVELSPGDHESVRGGASYAWFEFEVAPSGVIPVVHADDEWWQTAPGPASLIAAARASCDWDLLEELGAPTDERGGCSDRRGRELLGHANRAASDVLAHLSDPGDFYDLDPDDQYREILAIAGLSAGLQNEAQRARQRYRDAIDRHGASRETALERAYRRGDAPAFEVAERSGREPGWRTPEQQPDRGQAERRGAQMRALDVCLRVRANPQRSEELLRPLNDAPPRVQGACARHLDELREREEQARAQLSGFPFGGTRAQLRARCQELGGDWSVGDAGIDYCRVRDATWGFTYSSRRASQLMLFMPGEHLGALSRQFGPSVRRGQHETWMLSVRGDLWAVRYGWLTSIRAWVVVAFDAAETSEPALAARLDREAGTATASPARESTSALGAARRIVGRWRCGPPAGQPYTEEYLADGTHRVGDEVGSWRWIDEAAGTFEVSLPTLNFRFTAVMRDANSIEVTGSSVSCRRLN